MGTGRHPGRRRHRDDRRRISSRPTAKALYVLRAAAATAAADGVTWAWTRRNMRGEASRVLDEARPAVAAGRARLDGDWMRFWNVGGQDTGGARGGCVEANLRGLALVGKAADGGAGSCARSARVNSAESQGTIRRDFRIQAQMDPGGVGPYLEATADATVEAQLLKYTRVSQPDAKATATYSKR